MGEEEVRGERLARVEVEVKGVREDLTEFRTEMREMWSTMIKQAVTHVELDGQLALRDLRIKQLEDTQKDMHLSMQQDKKTSVNRKQAFWVAIVAAVAGACVSGLVSLVVSAFHK